MNMFCCTDEWNMTQQYELIVISSSLEFCWCLSLCKSSLRMNHILLELLPFIQYSKQAIIFKGPLVTCLQNHNKKVWIWKQWPGKLLGAHTSHNFLMYKSWQLLYILHLLNQILANVHCPRCDISAHRGVNVWARWNCQSCTAKLCTEPLDLSFWCHFLDSWHESPFVNVL